MKLNIVTEPKPGWVLRMMAENWSRFIPNSTITTMKPCLSSDINFYVNWDIFNKKTNLDIGWFTHCEEAGRGNFEEKARQMDYCICPAQNTLKLLPVEKSCVLKHGIDEEYINHATKKIKFGIVGREYSSGRKNFDVIDKLKSIPNASFYISGGNLSKGELIDLYKDINYLIVTSTNEGGPVPVIEALTMGVPVIAPDVGWCWEYPVIKYTHQEELYNIINTLCSFTNVNKIWEDSSEQLLHIFQKLYKNLYL